MSIYSSIDLETFKWVKSEVEETLNTASGDLQKYASSGEKESLLNLGNHLHQVVGSLQMLEMKSLSALVMETEQLVEDYTSSDDNIRKPAFLAVIDQTFVTLRSSFDHIESGLPENPADAVELS